MELVARLRGLLQLDTIMVLLTGLQAICAGIIGVSMSGGTSVTAAFDSPCTSHTGKYATTDCPWSLCESTMWACLRVGFPRFSAQSKLQMLITAAGNCKAG